MGARWGPFIPVATANGVALDFMTLPGEITTQHYAFLVTEAEFDAIFDRIHEAKITYYPEPHMTRKTRSTTTTAVAASTSSTPRATAWRSSPCPTAAGPTPEA